MKPLYFALFSLILIPFLQADYGVDVSTLISVENWTCLKTSSYTFAVVRIYRSVGKIDDNAVNTINNARTAGILNVDGYIFPCFKCGNPREQVQDAVQNLKMNNAVVNKIWIDVEGTQYWGPSGSENVKFIGELVDEVKNQNYPVGIYASASQWNPITNSSTELGDIELWYPHWDKKENFTDFKAFGGWKAPVMKQYEGTTTVCSVGIDKNWRP